MARYNTKQKKIILDFLNDNKTKCLTVNDIREFLLSKEIKVGQTTIYRYLTELEDIGMVIRYQNEVGKSQMYQVIDNQDCKSHFHLKCIDCGNITHLECDVLDNIKDHIQEDHNFKLDHSKTTIYGHCNDCQKEKQDENN